MMRRRHHMPFGAEVLGEARTRFRLWAPAARRVHLCLDGNPEVAPVPMRPHGDGWFQAVVEGAGPGARYRFMVDEGTRVPDPASRFQPDDVHGPSEVIDPESFDWTDDGWQGRALEEAVFYEVHVGSFTPSGGFVGVMERLEYLAQLGVTAIELMPVADTPGRRGWGYDGVYLFAPEAAYGRPEDLKALVNAAHEHGIMVFLDVVYNHFGPEGNYSHLYAPQFFTERHRTPWGAGLNFDGGIRTVRDFFIHNALYWLEEFHIDGLRLDAVHAIVDESAPDILTELAETVSSHFRNGRRVHLVLENDHNASGYLDRLGDGRPRWYAAQWSDDIHHALHVLTTSESGGYYEDYADGPVRHLGRSLTEGFAYQGEASRFRGGAPRGTASAHLPPTAFVGFLQNHDQIGNRAFGERVTVLAPPEAVRAATAVLLLAPSLPLLFMGEEWGSRQPFPFFCDFGPDLADAVREGRRREFARFPQFQDEAARAHIPDPNAETTFAQAVLDWDEAHATPGLAWLALHRELLRLRHGEIIPRLAGVAGHAGSYRCHGDKGLMATWRLAGGEYLYLLANLGASVQEDCPAPPAGRVIFATSPEMTEGLGSHVWPPWSVAWLLFEGDGEGEGTS